MCALVRARARARVSECACVRACACVRVSCCTCIYKYALACQKNMFFFKSALDSLRQPLPDIMNLRSMSTCI